MLVTVVSVSIAAVCALLAVWALLRARVAEVRAEIALDAERRRLDEVQRHYDDTRAQAQSEFRLLARQIFDERSARLKAESGEHLQGVVSPLLKDLAELRQKIGASDVATAAGNAELKERIDCLVAQTGAVSAQANNLADALRGDARLAGEWGEIQLIKVLELAGLSENVDYTYQETFREEAGGRKTKRTDIVVKLPGGRALVIDAKNSVGAAVDWHAAGDDAARARCRERIVESLRRHVDEIAAADYPSAVPGAFPLAVMYVPLEEVYLLAVKAQIAVGVTRELLREYAQRKGVILANAASVVPIVKLVELMWSVERQEKNRREMARAANELLQRANDFVRDFLDAGEALERARAAFAAARTGLIDAPGGQSLAKAAAKLIRLGAEPKTRAGKPYTPVAPLTAAAESLTDADTGAETLA
jgi:DNA recombination protein RmuC